MKKKIVLGLLCILALFIVTGCETSKKALTAEEFTKIAEDNNLIIVDVKEQFAEHEEIETATIAAKENKWQIEHYQLATKDDAKKMFEKNKTEFESISTTGSKKTNVEVGNYTKYTQETDTYYMLLTRVDNTFLYVKVPVEYKEDALKVVKELGY